MVASPGKPDTTRLLPMPSPIALLAPAKPPVAIPEDLAVHSNALDDLIEEVEWVIAELAKDTWGPSGEPPTARPLPNDFRDHWKKRLARAATSIDTICVQLDLYGYQPTDP